MTRIIIAVRGGTQAKTRLAGVLGLKARQALVAAMLDIMLLRIGADRCIVVSPTQALLELAYGRGARPFAQAGGDLNAAFEAAYAECSGAAVLLPGDLPLIRAADLDQVLGALKSVDVVLSPSLADGGTAAIALAPGVIFQPAFGPSSFRRHGERAITSGLSTATVRRPGLGEDIDRPEDLTRLARIAAADPDLSAVAAALTPQPVLAEAI